MDRKVAEGIRQHYADLGRGALDGRKSRSLIERWLRAIGYEQDRYGNYLSKDRQTRWHFKEQVVRREKRHAADAGGGWFALSSTPLIEAGQNLLLKAAETLEDGEMLALVQKRVGARQKTAETRANKAKMEETLLKAKIDATKILSAKYPRRYFEAAVRDFKTEDARVMSDELAVLTDQALERVERGERIDDGKIVSLKKPPVACLFSDKISYFWIENVDGVDYSIYIAPKRSGFVEVHIGRPSMSPFTPLVSSDTMKLSLDQSSLKSAGDGYISGDITRRPDDQNPDTAMRGRLFLISSHKKQSGTGTRLLKIWCQLMAGYGIDRWIARGVGDEGRAAFQAWERGKKIDIVAEEGATMAIACRHRARSVFDKEVAEDPNQLRFPGMALGRSRKPERREPRYTVLALRLKDNLPGDEPNLYVNLDDFNDFALRADGYASWQRGLDEKAALEWFKKHKDARLVAYPEASPTFLREAREIAFARARAEWKGDRSYVGVERFWGMNPKSASELADVWVRIPSHLGYIESSVTALNKAFGPGHESYEHISWFVRSVEGKDFFYITQVYILGTQKAASPNSFFLHASSNAAGEVFLDWLLEKGIAKGFKPLGRLGISSKKSGMVGGRARGRGLGRRASGQMCELPSLCSCKTPDPSGPMRTGHCRKCGKPMRLNPFEIKQYNDCVVASAKTRHGMAKGRSKKSGRGRR